MRYDGFLSYSSDTDRRQAKALQRLLQDIARPFYRWKSLDIFRDETNLVANPALWPSIERALASSRTLIVLASPAAAVSVWCAREIEWWLANRSVESLYIVLTDGELVYDESRNDFAWPETTALPSVLAGRFPVEPLYVDLRWARRTADLTYNNQRLRSAVLPLAAALHGKQPQALEGDDLREFRRARRVWRSAAAVLALLTLSSITAAWFAVHKSREAERERAIAVARQLAAEAAGVRLARPDALPQSVLLAVEGVRRMQAQAMPSPRVDGVLRDGLRLLPEQPMRLGHKKVVALALDRTGQRLVSVGREGDIVTWDPESGTPLDGLDTEIRVDSALVSPDATLVALAVDRQVVVVHSVERRVVARIVHAGSVTALAFSGDSRRLAVGALDHYASVTRLADARELARFEHAAPVESVAFDHDGDRLASGTGSMAERLLGRPPADDAAHIWDVDGGRRLVRLPHEHIVEAVAFSADGNRLATGTRGGLARVWQIAEARELARVRHPDGVDKILFSPSDRFVASGSGPYLFASKDQPVKLWEVESGREVGQVVHQDGINAIAFSPDGHWLATASDDGSVRLLRFPNREVMRLGLDGQPAQLAFSRDNTLLIVGGSDLHLLPVGRGYWPVPIDHSGHISRLVVSPRYAHIALVESAKTLTVRSLDDAGTVYRVTHDAPVRDATSSADGRLLASAAGSTLLVSRAESGALQMRREHPAAVTAVAFDPAADLIASAAEDARVYLWEMGSGDQRTALAHDAPVIALSFDGLGKRLASVTRDGQVRLWDVVSGRSMMSKALDRDLQHVAFSPDGDQLAVAGFDTHVVVWDIRGGRQPTELMQSGNVSDLLYLPDGRLVVATWDGHVRVWSTGGLQLQTELRHDDTVNGLALSADGRFLATASSDRTTRVYATDDLQELARLTHPLAVSAVEFSPDGDRLLAASGDMLTPPHQLWVWPWRRETLLAEACRRLPRNLSLQEWRRHLGNEPYRRSCAQLPVHPSVITARLDHARDLAERGNNRQARELFARLTNDAHDSDELELLNQVCWFGGLYRAASEVLPLCDHAVALAAGNGAVNDSRGLARALSGDRAGAIADFTVFVEWADRNLNDSTMRARRQTWIEALRDGVNPFDDATLADLRHESH